MLCPVKWLNGECMQDVRVLGIRLWDTLLDFDALLHLTAQNI